jgi:hypothetical protein
LDIRVSFVSIVLYLTLYNNDAIIYKKKYKKVVRIIFFVNELT